MDEDALQILFEPLKTLPKIVVLTQMREAHIKVILKCIPVLSG
jgi:hypothetical protein